MRIRLVCLLLLGLLPGSLMPALAQDFPVTLTHAFGQTTIADKPRRIVTLGWMAQDAVLALGQVPVGMPRQAWGGDAQGLLPWESDAIADLGGVLPALYDDAQIPFEQLLTLAPDLILAPHSGITQADYARLSQIAPTIAWSKAAWTGSWQDVTRVVGEALGQGTDAQALIDATSARIAAIAAAHPQWAGKSFTFGQPDAGNASFNVYRGSDSRVRLLEDLGLVLSPGAAALPGDGFFVPVSLERLETLDADVVITWVNDQTALDALLGNALFARFAPVARGHLLALLDRSVIMATSAPSALSIPWALERLAPQLDAALAE